MSRASLLNSNEAAFPFEHAMAHRQALGVMSPLPRFSVIPYWIDPMTGNASWMLNHQTAHNDAALHLPSQFGSSSLGVAIWSNLLDYNLADPASRTWWTFINHMEHYVGGNTILPTVQPVPPAPQWTYPFW